MQDWWKEEGNIQRGKEKKTVLKTMWEAHLELLAAGRKDLVKGNIYFFFKWNANALWDVTYPTQATVP